MARKQAFTEDSFTNFLAKLGANTQNLQGYGHYSLSPFVSRLRTDLEASYRSSWLVGQVVDTVAEDMTREGVTINSKLPPGDVKLIQSTFTDLSIWHELANTIKWARLYGGAIAVILTEGADYEKPLNVNAVGKGRFKGLVVFDRWMLDPSFGDLVTEIGPSMGKPKYYSVLPGMPALSGQRVHYSRIIRFDGIELPYYQRLTENLWGLSVVERMYDRLMAFDSATQGASQLLHKAHLRTIQVKGFREALALGGATESAVVKQFNYIRMLQTLEGLTVLDGDDSFQVHPYSFSGISDVLMQFGEQISGATGIPLVRLFGQSPAGLSSTGESDLRNYYDHINKLQESQMRAPLVKLFDVIGRSVLGKALPKDFEFEFNSLWQLSDTEKGQIASTDATAIAAAYGAGLITKNIAMKELLQNSRITGRFTNITEEDIENAKEETPPAGEENPFASPPIGSESPGSLLPPSEKSIEDLQKELEALDIEGGGDEFADLKQKLDEIDMGREILDKPSAIDGARKFFKDGISKILKPLVGLALIYHWFKKDKQISTEERVNRLLGRSPYNPGQDSIKKKISKKEVLLSIQKELKNIRSTFDAHLRAPRGGVSIKGEKFKGGEFIPSEGGYAEEYKKMQKEGKSGSSEESKEEKSNIQEAFKKKYPNVSGAEARHEGLTKELAAKKVKELRDKGIYATFWHQEGPKSGSGSKYFVAVPEAKKSIESKSEKKKEFIYKLGTKSVAKTEKDKEFVEKAMKAKGITHDDLDKIADKIGDYNNVDINIMPFNKQLNVEMQFSVGEGNSKANFNFNIDDERGYIDLMVLPDSEGNKGRGHALLESLESMLREKGKDKLGLHADISIGGYAWAKMGFDFDDKSDLYEAQHNIVKLIDIVKSKGAKISDDDVKKAKSLKTAKEVAEFTIPGASFTTREWMKASKEVKQGMSQHVPKDVKLHIGKVVLLALNNDYYATKKVEKR